MDVLSRCLIAQFVQGRLPGRSMSFDTFVSMVQGYRPVEDATERLRTASKAMSKALAGAEPHLVQLLGQEIAAALARAPTDPLLAKALSALSDYIGDDRKEAVARWIGLLAIAEP